MARIVYSTSLRHKLSSLGFARIALRVLRSPAGLASLFAVNAVLVGAVAWKWHPDQLWSILPAASAHVRTGYVSPRLDSPAIVASAPEATSATASAGLKDESGIARKALVDESADARMALAAEYIHKNYRIAREAADMISKEAFRVSKQYKVDPILMLAIIGEESRFNPIAESSVGALGLTQPLPEAHPEKVNSMARSGHILNIADNIELGARIFSEYLRKFDGNSTKALQQYNGSLGDPRQGYSKRVLSLRSKIASAIS